MSWINQLLPASFRGIPFVVEQSGFTTGRRTAVHEYPYRNLPWVEDMGAATQQINFSGFLVGDDCYIQRDVLAAACAQKGPGFLVHPSLGPIPAACLTNATFNERVDRGRVVEVQLGFIVTQNIPVIQLITGPLAFISTIYATLNCVTTAIAAVKAVFSAVVGTALAVVGSVDAIVRCVTGFVGSVLALAYEPAAIFGCLNGLGVLTQTFGAAYSLSRYISGNVDGTQSPVLSGLNQNLPAYQLIANATQAVLDAAVASRGAVGVAANLAITTGTSDPNDPENIFLGTIQALTEALRNSITDPADQIRLLATLCSFVGDTYPQTGAPYSAAEQQLNDVVAAACRRAALFSLATATTNYIPTVTSDVVGVIALSVPLYDAEVLYAANQGDSATYNAMIALRSAVVNDLQTRGANLPSLITATQTANLPSFVLAYKLYQDSTRSDQITRYNNPIHPLFNGLYPQVLST